MPEKKNSKSVDEAVTISKEGLLIALGISFLLNIVLVIALSFLGFRSSSAPNTAATTTNGSTGTEQTQTTNSEWIQQIPSFEARVKENPKDVQALIGLGNGYFDKGDFASAIKYYGDSLKIDPKNPDVLTDMGYAYLNNNNIQEAKTNFFKATQVSPNHVKAHYNLGVVLKQLGDNAGAKKEFQKVIEIAPQSEEAANSKQAMTGLRPLLLNRKRIDFWAKFVAVAIVLAFAGAGVVQWGSAMLFSEESGQATQSGTEESANKLDLLTQAFAQDPGNEEVAVSLAQEYSEKGDTEAAGKVYTAALAKQPKSIRLLSAFGAFYLDNEQGSQALSQFMSVLKEDPDSYYGHLGVAYAYEMLDKKDLAIATLKSFLAKKPKDSEKQVAEQELQRLQTEQTQ